MNDRKWAVCAWVLLACLTNVQNSQAAAPPPLDLLPAPISNQAPTPYAAWANGLSDNPDYFPIGVWLQAPSRAVQYKAAGFNLYIGLWAGPTSAQLTALTQVGMPVICDQNAYALTQLNNPIIVAWMHGDEPDNAQSFAGYWQSDVSLIDAAWPQYAGLTWTTWGPPAAPWTITNDYNTIVANDPSRPVMLNLGQGVSWHSYIGRGVRRGHTEDYPIYTKGCDIVSFDIYPVVHSDPTIAGALWRIPYGLKYLRGWANDEKIFWDVIECTHISNPGVKATPAQVKAEVWMSLIFGARGLIYFVHQFEPTFIEAALLADPVMTAAVTEINNQIHGLAPVLNSPSVTGLVQVSSSHAATPVCIMVKQAPKHLYVFAVAMHDEATTATFQTGLSGSFDVEVLGEDRSTTTVDGVFSDAFSANAVHLYRMPLKGTVMRLH